MRTSSGVLLYSKLKIMTFTPTDLPEPVVPATNKWGIFAKSTTTGLPEISAPSTIVNGDLLDWKVSQLITSLKRTISRFLFGSSKPITDLPGITSTTRTEMADIARARSFESPVILLTFTPGAKSSSKRVITGPGKTPTTVASMLKSASFSSTKREMPSISSGVRGFSCLSARSSKSNDGIGGKSGSISPALAFTGLAPNAAGVNDCPAF